MNNLLIFIRSITDFSDKSWEILKPTLTLLKLKKGEYLLKSNTVCNSLFFINAGYCKAFFQQEGQEINTAFYFENDIATDINSYLKNEYSTLSIQACEPISVIRFDKDKLIEVNKLSPEIEAVGKKCIHLIAAKQEDQIKLFRLMTIQKRYEFLETNKPEILQRVSLTQLSSYLGVSRETLSRMRRKRLQK